MTCRWTQCAGPRSNVDPSGAKAKGRTGKFAIAADEGGRQIGIGAAGEEEQAVVLGRCRGDRGGKLEEDGSAPDWGFWQVDLTAPGGGSRNVKQ